jgi:hypothetical protein
MPDQPQSDKKEEKREWIEREEPDDWFSQEDDDLAGRSWHGMNSDYEVDQVGRFDSDDDNDDDAERKRRPS